jgi:hypothetical protein
MSAETAKPILCRTLVAALVACSGAAPPEVLLEPEGEIEDEPEDKGEVDSLALDDEAVYATLVESMKQVAEHRTCDDVELELADVEVELAPTRSAGSPN